MIEIELTAAIRRRAEELLKDLILPADRKGAPRAPNVINGWLPPKRGNSEPDYPFVVIRPGTGVTSGHDTSRVTVKMLVGVFGEDVNGYEYALQIMTRLRLGFIQSPILENRFIFELPFNWELFDEQPAPVYELSITTEWLIHTPQILPELGGF